MIIHLLTLIWSIILISKSILGDNNANNWLVRSAAYEFYELGIASMAQNDVESAISSLLSSYHIFPTFLACEKIGWIKENLGLVNESRTWYSLCTEVDDLQISSQIRLGNTAYRNRDYATALLHVNNALTLQADSLEAFFLKGVILQNMGDIQGAANVYFQGTEVNPLEVKCTLNLATLHHKYGSVNDALFFYQMVLTRLEVFMSAAARDRRRHLNRFYLMVKSNLAAAYLQLGVLARAYSEITDLVNILVLEDAEYCQQNQLRMASEERPVTCAEISRTISSSLGVQMIIQRTSAHWFRWETIVDRVVSDTLATIATGIEFEGPLLPFDTLLTVMPLEDRLTIARSASALVSRGRPEMIHGVPFNNHPRKLKIGFMSFDFNNHPTAHLIEGIFSIIRKHKRVASPSKTVTHSRFDNVELFIYSYGKDDNSTYRRSLEALADQFIEISHLSHKEAADRIHSDTIDILLDLQLHTLGHRFEITAHRPAPVQINYLVYPGTSGASFLNYIIGDHVVIPAEHAPHYSESLLLLPPTYQVSFFDRMTHLVDPSTVNMSISERRSYLRRFHGLPTGPEDIIFCNFNKIDKIDPQSFVLWMSILRRVPHSYLWLLQPAEDSQRDIIVDKNNLNDLLERDSRASSLENNLVREHLVANAVALGVKESQLLFAPRTDKESHIFRHAAADLFLDTLVYGAHSTATDALRGGLPVLTVLGDTFPSRVAPSLYASLSGVSASGDILLNTLVVHSLREFEDLAVHLTSQNSLSALMGLKNCLADVVENSRGLFDTVGAVDKFVRGMMAVQDARVVIGNKRKTRDYHIIVTNKIS